MSRKIIPFVVAFVLVCLVMAVAGVFTFSGAITAEKFGDTVGWFKQYNAAESMKVIDLTGPDARNSAPIGQKAMLTPAAMWGGLTKFR